MAARLLKLPEDEMLEHIFGDVPIQILQGDFMQLNPVKGHTLLEAFCKTPVPGVPKETKEEDNDGYRVFREACQNVILFEGAHRFLDEDLPALLDIMRTPGGQPVPKYLRMKIADRIQSHRAGRSTFVGKPCPRRPGGLFLVWGESSHAMGAGLTSDATPYLADGGAELWAESNEEFGGWKARHGHYERVRRPMQ